jgi:hypothetical protein
MPDKRHTYPVRITFQTGKHEFVNVICRQTPELLAAVTGAELWRSPRPIQVGEMAHHEIEAEISMAKYRQGGCGV